MSLIGDQRVPRGVLQVRNASATSVGAWLRSTTGSRVTVTDSNYIDHFELTSTDDDTARGCLTTTYDGGLFHDGPVYVEAGYDSGAC